MTTVKAELKYVRNLGNFESIHVHIGVEDTLRENEKVNDGFDRVYAFVEAKLLEKVKEIERELK